MSTDWLDELQLDPAAPAPAMATRALGAREWLVADNNAEAEMALKRRLSGGVRHAVFGQLDGAGYEAIGHDAAGVLDLVLAQTGVPEALRPVPDRAPPLEAAGLSTQEDLCMLARRPDGWYLAAASLHFPSRWRLADKLGKHISAVHQPVPGYATRLAKRVDSLLDALDERPVWRRNWFIHELDELHQPTPPPPLVVPAEACGTALTVRSERQTLRGVGRSVLFTIKVQRTSLGEFVQSPDRREALARFVSQADATRLRRHGVGAQQAEQLRIWLSEGSAR
ncbi:MAG: DUF3445 domain-containing protein [Acidimicrobiales bacterium]